MGIRTNMRTVDLQEVEERLEDNVRQARKFGRRAVRIYAGLWGMAYDEAMMVVDRGMHLFDRAEDRGQTLESTAGDGLCQLRQQAGERLEGLQSRVRRDVRRELPIPGYDTFTVKEVEPLLAALSADELTDLALYEATNENRVTLLRAIEDELEVRRKEISD